MQLADHFEVWDGTGVVLTEGVASLGFDIWGDGAPVLVLDMQDSTLSPLHSYDARIMLGLFRKEAAYNAWIPAWNATTACSMLDFDHATPDVSWDDLVEDDDTLVHNYEYATVQEIVRQSVRFTYTEPRTKPNTLAGLLGLALGTISTIQDGGAAAYRHKLTPAAPMSLPSINVQIAHYWSGQFLYTGIKADSFTLRNNGSYLSFACPLIGSGAREEVFTEYVPAIEESWLRWGDCHLYLSEVSLAPLTVPTAPAQSGSNLGIDAVDISTRVLRMEVNHPNALWAEGGYRPSTGVLRGNLLTAKRHTDVMLEMQVDNTLEIDLLTRYLEQTPLAFEWQCTTGTLIDSAGIFKYGASIIIPKLQFLGLKRGEQFDTDTLEITGRVLDDKTNPVIVAWVWNGQGTYLA